MKELITSFCSKNLNGFEVDIQHTADDMINLYVQKDTSGYKLVANLVTLNKMNFNETDLECLLYHEKGHYELKHLEAQNNLLINSLLASLLMVISATFLVFKLFWAINLLFIFLPLGIALYLIYDNLKYLNRMRKAEMQADGYACIYCKKEDFISMLQKMETFYSHYQKKNKYELLYLLETHPSTEKRIQAISNYSSIY
jgi:Zn-dependent protease with chaperone function